MDDPRSFFTSFSGHTPHPWQADLISEEACEDLLLRIPTGFGKTLGVASAWAWHRLKRNDERWPHRLVWCLPMRVLVEQTAAEIESALARTNLLRNPDSNEANRASVHILMGGEDAGQWDQFPERPAVLVGTQDMLLSRALNRGYAASRARWPMQFGLLNQDALWVLDEVQLMDAGLATSAQLQSFRKEWPAGRPVRSWWMSATLQEAWLKGTPEARKCFSGLKAKGLAEGDRTSPLWQACQKELQLEATPEAQFAERVLQAHKDSGSGKSGPTLVVVNRVDRAVALYSSLLSHARIEQTEIKLVHSRFRPAERYHWRDDLFDKKACSAGTDRILISTQIVEAGVDLSAATLVTELAPWPNLVQRFGRCARWGGRGRILVLDPGFDTQKLSAPYTPEALAASREALGLLSAADPSSLETLEQDHPELVSRLYPYEPDQVITRDEIVELFDTTPDLSGADIDIARFIRKQDARDAQIYWRSGPPEELNQPDMVQRSELCTVPVHHLADWLCGKESSTKRSPHLKDKMLAWHWDWLDGKWQKLQRRHIRAGVVIRLDASCGGYKTDAGWTATSRDTVQVVSERPVEPYTSDRFQDDEGLSERSWKTISFHGKEVGELASQIADQLIPAQSMNLSIAGRWHDAGKAFSAFQDSMVHPDRPIGHLLAKAPASAWLRGRALYPMIDGGHRPGFRHELLSVLALFEVLHRHRPDHPALLGPWIDLLASCGEATPVTLASSQPCTAEQELLDLGEEDFNMVAYLVSAHHGKLRAAWNPCPADQQNQVEKPRLRGIEDGDILPALRICDTSGDPCKLPELVVDLSLSTLGLSARTGPSWRERVDSLIDRYGPFHLAWLEALLRAADQRASESTFGSADPELTSGRYCS